MHQVFQYDEMFAGGWIRVSIISAGSRAFLKGFQSNQHRMIIVKWLRPV
jgi:hypothetical protein